MTWPETQAWAAARVRRHLDIVAAKLEFPEATVTLDAEDRIEVRRGDLVFCEVEGGWAVASLEALLALDLRGSL